MHRRKVIFSSFCIETDICQAMIGIRKCDFVLEYMYYTSTFQFLFNELKLKKQVIFSGWFQLALCKLFMDT